MKTAFFSKYFLYLEIAMLISFFLAFALIEFLGTGGIKSSFIISIFMSFVLGGINGLFRLKGIMLNNKIFRYLPDAEHIHTAPHSDSAIALSPSNRKILLIYKNLHKVYDFNEIRSWQINTISGGTLNTIGAKLTTQIDGFKFNLFKKYKNEINSGIYLKVKDIKYPEWFVSAHQHTQNSWMEILTQNINES
jgi:hypothetical protein